MIIPGLISFSIDHKYCVLSIVPVSDGNSGPYLGKQPNQIKSGNRCCSELCCIFKESYQRIFWFYSFSMYLGQPSPATPTDHIRGLWDGWRRNGLARSHYSEMELPIFTRPLSPSPRLGSSLSHSQFNAIQVQLIGFTLMLSPRGIVNFTSYYIFYDASNDRNTLLERLYSTNSKI